MPGSNGYREDYDELMLAVGSDTVTHSVASPINECKKSALPNVPVTSGGAGPLGVLMMTDRQT